MSASTHASSSVTVLFLGGAKRVSMARKFKEAAARMGLACRILSYEIGPDVPIACEAEVITGLRWKDPEIYADLHRICEGNGVVAVIPFVDGAVGVAAEYTARHPGTVFVPTGSREVAETMFDKIRAAAVFQSAGLPVPRTYCPGDSPSMLIAKPRHGSASKGITPIDTQEELDAILTHDGEYLIQRRIDHRREITIDCYVAADGRPVAVVPRTRDEVTGGEVSRTTVIHYPAATDLALRTLAAIPLRGAVTIQLIEDLDAEPGTTGRLMLMEINPRLGGGAVATVHAGIDLPGLILSEATARPLPSSPMLLPYRDTIVTRYLDEISFPL